jgi:hypothetical protein
MPSPREKSGEHSPDDEVRFRDVRKASGRGRDRRRAREPSVLRPEGLSDLKGSSGADFSQTHDEIPVSGPEFPWRIVK